MPTFLADQNFDENILGGLLVELSALDVVRAIDVGLARADDPALLEWAASQGRVVLTHDRRTLIGHAYARVTRGLPMPGVVVVRTTLAVGATIEHLVIMIGASGPDEWENQVRHIPL